MENLGSRRQAIRLLEAEATTNAALWLEKGLANVEDKGPGRQRHFEDLTQRVRVPRDYPRFFERWRKSLEALEPHTETVEATVLGRMAVGLGAESVLETAIALHRTYGVPYIPGSALKGLAAAAAHQHLENSVWRKVLDDGTMGESHQILFGNQESSGYVTFHDALWIPNGDPLPFDLDVMTVHHPGYYRGEGPPADWDSPNPVAFLSARGKYLLAATGPEDWVNAAMEILKDALEKDGIGAKTAAGYGRMKVHRAPRPEPLKWEPLVPTLNFGNAGDKVPFILNQLKGSELRKAAEAIIARLDRRALREKNRRDKDWVKQLFAATGDAPDPPPTKPNP